jgi:hypothetical protein
MVLMRSVLGFGTLLLLLIPHVAGAREAWGQQPRARLSLAPEVTAGGTRDSELSRALRSTDGRTEVSAKAREPLPASVAAEVMMGGMFGAGGMLVGGIAGGVVGVIAEANDPPCLGDSCGLSGLGYIWGGMLAGLAVTAPFGVYTAGSMADGQGLLLPTLASSLASGGLAALTLEMMGRLNTSLGALVMVFAPIVGSVIGYEVSHFVATRERRSAATRGVQVLPTAGVTSSGTGVFGLVGRF